MYNIYNRFMFQINDVLLNFYSLQNAETVMVFKKKKKKKNILLLLGKVRDRFGGMGRFNGGLRCKGWVNSVIINVIT